MMNLRLIDFIVKGPNPHMVGDGFRVSQYLPGVDLEKRMSPFLMLDYHAPYRYEPSSLPKGVGAHPHRGFETVTIAYQGSIEYHDNQGNHGIIHAGDVQWMSAASGVLHKEYHEKEFSQNGGVLHMIQLWVNLPTSMKMNKPKYQALLKKDMGYIDLKENGSIQIIAGQVDGISGPASTATPINMYNVHMNKGSRIVLNEPSHFNTGLLAVKGNVTIQGQNIDNGDLVIMQNNEGQIIIESQEEAIVFVMSGEPIHEPIVFHGPFVMNSEEEIRQAYKDYYDGYFGNLDF